MQSHTKGYERVSLSHVKTKSKSFRNYWKVWGQWPVLHLIVRSSDLTLYLTCQALDPCVTPIDKLSEHLLI